MEEDEMGCYGGGGHTLVSRSIDDGSKCCTFKIPCFEVS